VRIAHGHSSVKTVPCSAGTSRTSAAIGSAVELMALAA
jgi:hypothetical protein